MPRKKSQFKSVLTKRQEDGLIHDKLAYLNVTSDDPPELQCVTVISRSSGDLPIASRMANFAPGVIC